jgi:hypothetical protein
MLQIITKIDNTLISKFPYENNWVLLQKQDSPKTVTLYIPEIQLEVSYNYNLWKFVVRMSPQIFPETEGLCGENLLLFTIKIVITIRRKV